MVGAGYRSSRSTRNGTTTITLEYWGGGGLVCIYEQEINQFHPHYFSSLQKVKSKFSQCLELLDHIVKPDSIVTSKKDLDNVELKQSSHNIDER